MPRAKLTLEPPDGTWIRDVSTAYPAAGFHVVAVLSGTASGTALVELRTADPVPLLGAIDDHDDVASLDLLWKQDDQSMVQVEVDEPRLLGPVVGAGVPIETPFTVRDGRVEWELTTSDERLSALRRRLDDDGVQFEAESVVDDPASSDDGLTDRQRELLLAAVEQGYYETPRRATLTEVAASMGISKATGSDVLHRAEETVVSWFLDEHLASGRR